MRFVKSDLISNLQEWWSELYLRQDLLVRIFIFLDYLGASFKDLFVFQFYEMI